uniref:Protein kinase domain-containing protein n=1 Tax=Anopheles christyi TaxID=43041 RepID=A0A182JZG7_9DIPT
MEGIYTQPLNSDAVSMDLLTIQTQPSYGQLLGSSALFGTIDLYGAKFNVGRDRRCSLVIDEVHFPLPILSFISNIHFTLERDHTDRYNPTYMIDNSTNGTYVDGKLVGKNNRAILLHGSKISIACFTNIFVYNQPDYNAPQEVDSEVLKKRYHIGRTLGSGSFGTVYLLHDIITCLPYALKIVKKQRYGMNLRGTSSLLNEANIMQKLDHPCVIRMFQFMDDVGSISMVLEYMQGGDLLTRIMDNGFLPENTAKFYFYQLCHAIYYLHGEGITHRDLKPDNILLQDSNEYTLLKVSDFGSSKFQDSITFMRTICGTPEYVAPEILESSGQKMYTCQVDVWSLGVVLYTMLSGLLPFGNMNGKNDAEQIMRGNFSMAQPVWRSGQSCRSKKLIYDILNVDPNQRPSIEMLLESVWFRNSNVVQHARSLVNLPSLTGKV